jgi:hypothetical protein
LTAKADWKELAAVVKNPRCGEKGEENKLPADNQVVPTWVPKASGEKTKTDAKKNEQDA